MTDQPDQVDTLSSQTPDTQSSSPDCVQGSTQNSMVIHMPLEKSTSKATYDSIRNLTWHDDNAEQSPAPTGYVPNSDSSDLLPSMFKALPATLDSSDIRFLSRKGALTVLLAHLQIILLEYYEASVHCHFPLVDLSEVREVIVHGNPYKKKISLLLVQALMFAASGFVPMRYLPQLGFLDRESMHEAFLNRVRVHHFISL